MIVTLLIIIACCCLFGADKTKSTIGDILATIGIVLVFLLIGSLFM